jgi:polyhydroxyalkanoate synthesis regulator phasin
VFELSDRLVSLEQLLQLQPIYLVQESAASVLTQILTALIVGLLTAFALQLLLTSFGVAIGITALGFWVTAPKDDRPSSPDPNPEFASNGSIDRVQPSNHSASSTIAKVGTAAGFGILLTINLVMLVSCFLAARFSQVADPVSGAIAGVVIWSAYFLILAWVSSSAVSSLLGTILGSTLVGFRRIVSAASAAFNRDDRSTDSLTEADAIAMIRQEMQSVLNSADLRQTLEDYLATLSPPQPSPDQIRQDFATLLEELDLTSLARQGEWHTVNRQTFVDLIEQRTSLSTAEVEQAADQLEAAWQEAIDRNAGTDSGINSENDLETNLNSDLLAFLKTASPDELQPDRLANRLEQVMNSDSAQPQASGGMPALSLPDVTSLFQTLWNRVDLSDLDLEAIWQQLQSLKHHLSSDTADQSNHDSTDASFNTIATDIEYYLRHTESWRLNSAQARDDVKDIFYDPDAAPEQVRSQLEPLQPACLAEILQQRDDLSPEQIDAVLDRLIAVRLEVLDRLEAAELEEQQRYLQHQLQQYVQTANAADLISDTVTDELEALVTRSGISPDLLVAALTPSQWLIDQLADRPDLNSETAQQIVDDLIQASRQIADHARRQQVEIQSVGADLWQKLESYLRYTSPQYLTPKSVQHKLEMLLDEAQSQLAERSAPLPAFDRTELEAVLDRRQSLDTHQKTQILNQMEETWTAIGQSSEQQSEQPSTAQPETSQSITEQIAEVLTKSLEQLGEAAFNWSELDLEALTQTAIQRIVTPTVAAWAVRQQLHQIDWHALQDRLQQSQVLNETQIQTILDGVRYVVRQILKPPRRWANRAQKQIKTVSHTLTDYLQSTDKTTLSPDSIQHSLQQVLRSQADQGDMPIHPLAELLDRLPMADQLILDRPTVLASLLQRQDLTESEALAIADQIESMRYSLIEQLKQTQQTQPAEDLDQPRSTTSELLDKITSYIDSLNGPQLDYNAVKQNVSNLFDDSQSSLTQIRDAVRSLLSHIPVDGLGDSLETMRDSAMNAIRDQVDQLSRDALATLLQSRQNLSETVRHYLLSQAEGLRDRMMQRVEQIQDEAQQRVMALRQQAQKRVEETRKAAAAAAWWLFLTTLTSALSAALAGGLATQIDFAALLKSGM